MWKATGVVESPSALRSSLPREFSLDWLFEPESADQS